MPYEKISRPGDGGVILGEITGQYSLAGLLRFLLVKEAPDLLVSRMDKLEPDEREYLEEMIQQIRYNLTRKIPLGNDHMGALMRIADVTGLDATTTIGHGKIICDLKFIDEDSSLTSPYGGRIR